jgi:ATP-dependent DNA helicase RecG
VPDCVLERKNSLPLQYLKGVGPARAQALSRLGIQTPQDLLAYYPRDWQDRRLRFSVADAPLGEKVALRGVIRFVEFTATRSSLGLARAQLEDSSGRIDAVWFKKMNPRYDVFSSLRRHLREGLPLVAYGTIEWGMAGRQIRVEDFTTDLQPDGEFAPEEKYHFDRIVPAYTANEGISERLLRTLIGRVLSTPPPLTDLVPKFLRDKWHLRDRAWAVQTLHFPESLIQKEEARQTLAFEEFFLLETALAMVRRKVKQKTKGRPYTLHRTLLTPFRQHLGFDFTRAQKRVIKEIFDDMLSPHPMNRLLQGDVGSGKTLVALSAMLLAVENGGQAVLMAPTEILAEQHAITLRRFLKDLPVRFTLLTGRTAPAQRKKILKEISEGQTDLIVGTHALVQNPVRFADLRVAVIDEQHRFGVEHRRMLREKGTCPDILVMTATPIPRTLALTLYGDLEISVLDELPPGRKPIATLHRPESEVYEFIQRTIQSGQQAYVVYPLVAESDKSELKAAVQEAEILRRTAFRNCRVGLLHGQLPGREKEAIMEQFRQHQIDLLIATSIIEVGIDVPNATVMAIQHAERFGLASLHQLRGRVGRGELSSTCLLIAQPLSEESRRRIQIMTEVTDGFRLSEEDLALRGPGEVMGVMQHGMPTFQLGDLVRDARIIQQSRLAAEELLAKDPQLQDNSHASLRRALGDRYAQKWSLGMTS